MIKQKLQFETCPGRRCFTLVELLLVVAVIAVVAGLGGGVYVGTYKKMLVEKAARSFLLTAEYARIMAVEHQHAYQIKLDLANNGFFLTTSQLDEQTGRTEETIVRDYYCKPVEFEGNVKFEDIQIMPVGTETTIAAEEQEEQQIVFLPNGTAEQAVVQIGDDKTHYTVSICAATGRAKMNYGTMTNANITTIDLDAE